jgi:ELWxxDGT repeat protein
VEQLEDRTLPSGTPQLLANINPGTASSNPTDFVTIGSTTYFVANDGTHGTQLWETNGTAAGTVMVADINGTAGSSPSYLTNVNGTLYFTVQGNQLWKSNGTAAGTVEVASFTSVGDLTNFGSELYFAASNGTQVGLWKSDGTGAGTSMVAGISGGVADLTNVNGELYFAASNGTQGTELWKSDGTAAGTSMVVDINTGAASSNPSNLTSVNGALYFTANDGVHGTQLWTSNGTAAGTVMLTDINPTSGGSFAGDLTNVNGTLYFTVQGSQLWKSNGTAASTVEVAGFASVSDLTNFNGEVYFAANDGTHGTELWKSDGTAAGTTMVADINPGTTTTWYYTGTYGTFTQTTTSTSSYPTNLTNVNGTLYFSANDGTHGYELWKSDGTAAGTTMVQDIFPGSSVRTYTNYYSYGTETRSASFPNSSYPNNLTNVNGTLLFAANDGTQGNELWMLQPGPSLAVSAASSTPTAGQADTFTITALNADGTVNTTFSGTVNITSSDPKAILPASVTLTNGTGQFSATLETAGAQSITATVAQTPSDSGSDAGIVVQPAAANSFTLTGFPSPATLGTASTFTVTAYDAFGNVATAYSGTVAFTSSDPKAVLPGNATLTGGTGQFSTALNTLGTNLSITATDTKNSALTATLAGIEVIPFASVTGPPAGAIGQTLTYTLGAGGDPAGTVFTVSWGDGTSTQTTATTVSHTYTSSANYSISVTATVNGLTSNPATETVDIVPVSVTVEADPAQAGAEMLVITDPGNLVLAGNSSSVSLTYYGIALGNVLPTNNQTFALVEAFATGTSQDILNASNLSVSSVLVGGSGGCTLYGGSGRNLLIAGTGSGTLYAGSAGDILIGGTTSYDSNTTSDQTALAYIMAEWDSTASYSTRVNQLSGKLGSGGLNGSYFLGSATVSENNALDQLHGYSLATGSSLDWFFAHRPKKNGDQVYNQVGGEVVTNI